MPRFAVEFHPLGADEAQAAERWYRERNETASERFLRELDRALERISDRPEAGSPYLSNTRRVLLRRYPFFVVYRVRGDNVQIVAVAQPKILARRGRQILATSSFVRSPRASPRGCPGGRS